MGKAILTPKQLNFLERVSSEKQITKRFYLTGGTALSEFYLKHRQSEDIDLFTEKAEVDQKTIDAKAKFDWHIDRITLASQFIRVKEFKDKYPAVLKPFNYDAMERFFLAQAKKLEKEIFKN